MNKWFESHAKRIADTLTAMRATLVVILPWLGWVHGIESLSTAVWLMVVDWTGDAIDGAIARRNRPIYHTWLGDHDLEVDMMISAGLLGYLVTTGFVSPIIAVLYLLVWALVLWRLSLPRSLGMLFQAPIYGWFILIAVYTKPAFGGWLLLWIILVMIVSWPRFPQDVVPNFLKGLHNLRK